MNFSSPAARLLIFWISASFLLLLVSFRHSDSETFPEAGLGSAIGQLSDIVSAKEKLHGRKLLSTGSAFEGVLKIVFGVVGFIVFALLACLGMSCCFQRPDDSTAPIARSGDHTNSPPS